MLSEHLFIEELNKVYFADVIDRLNYHISSDLQYYLSRRDKVNGAMEFIEFINRNGTLPLICGEKSVTIPSDLKRSGIKEYIRNKCDHIKYYLIDNICLYLSMDDAIVFRSQVKEYDIFTQS